MIDTERAYIAGIVDGEGSIMLTRFHKNQLPSPCVSVASTDKELLLWLQKIIGKGRIINKRNYNRAKHKDSYTYRVIYDDAIELLREISPFLIIETKKKRAKLIIDKYKKVTPRNGRYNDEMFKKKKALIEEFMQL